MSPRGGDLRSLATTRSGGLARKGEWERVFDALAEPILVLDARGVSLQLNRALRALLGGSNEEGRGVHWRTLLGPVGPQESCPVTLCLGDGSTHVAEGTFEKLDGAWQIVASPYLDEAERSVGAVVALHDVTASRRQQLQVFEAARLSEIGQLAGGIAHEINTPLASIALRAESLLERSRDAELRSLPAFERFPRYLETIDQEIFRCKRIITSLLDFARSGRAETQAIDLNELLRAAADLVGYSLRRKGLSLEARLDPALPQAHADPVELRQVALALLTNAVDAAAENGTLVIGTGSTAEGDVFLEVSDDGCGIPEADRDRIFTPFFTTKRATRGTGLGLAVCRQVVAAHGGRIEVSDVTGGGTRFRVVLPKNPRAS